MYFFEIIDEGKQSSAIKVDELKLNASFLNSKKTQEQETTAEPEGENFSLLSLISILFQFTTMYLLTLQFLGDVQTVRPKRKGGKTVANSNHSFVTKQREISNQENCNEDSYQGCEILSFMDFPTLKNSKYYLSGHFLDLKKVQGGW